MNDSQNEIISAINIITDDKVASAQYDKTVKGTLKEINETKATVTIDGSDYICDIKSGINIQVGDVVMVTFLQNDSSNKYIDGKLGYPISNGTATDHNHNDIYYTKTEIDTRLNTYVYSQISPSAEWDIVHNLKKYPSVKVIDSGGNAIIGDEKYVSENEIIITFSSAFAGKVYLN